MHTKLDQFDVRKDVFQNHSESQVMRLLDPTSASPVVSCFSILASQGVLDPAILVVGSSLLGTGFYI